MLLSNRSFIARPCQQQWWWLFFSSEFSYSYLRCHGKPQCVYYIWDRVTLRQLLSVPFQTHLNHMRLPIIEQTSAINWGHDFYSVYNRKAVGWNINPLWSSYNVSIILGRKHTFLCWVLKRTSKAVSIFWDENGIMVWYVVMVIHLCECWPSFFGLFSCLQWRL